MTKVVEIGAARLRRRPLAASGEGDKETRGCVLVIAGSQEVPGAALLAGEAAFAAGAGKVTLAAPGSCAMALGMTLPEARIRALPTEPVARLFDEADAVVLGPGMAHRPARLWAEFALGRTGETPLLLDAAALAMLWNSRALHRRKKAGTATRCILTPHAGELAGLAGISKEEVESDPLAAARDAAAHLGAIVVLKGPTTIVATGDGALFRHRARIPGLAMSGSGDVLAGIVGGLLARGATALDASLWGVFLHAQAGRRLAASVGAIGYRARELAGEVPPLMDRMR